MTSQAVARRIVDAIEFEMNDRKGMHWDQLDDDILQELKASLTTEVQTILEGGMTRRERLRRGDV